MEGTPAPRRDDALLLKLYGARHLGLWSFRRRFVHRVVLLAWILRARGRRIAKRLFDLIVGVILLITTLPVMIAAAIAIKLDSPGPIFFTQARVRQWGKTFRCRKFRSMYEDAEIRRTLLEAHNEAAGPVFKMRSDPRVTRVGRIIRKLSIDELPQLFNVLHGEMSLVGPRPPIPSEVAQYTPEQRQRLGVKPGITCIWQVSGRSDVDFERWVTMDLQYIAGESLWMDIRLLLRTIPAVLFGKGAY